MWCLKKNIHLTAQHLPGVEYVIADAESQSIRHRSDWQLDPAIFRQIAHWFGPIDVDLFATSLATQCPVSAGGQILVQQQRMHSYRTGLFPGLCKPSLELDGRTLSKVLADKTRIVLVAPVWKTQPWYPQILQLLIAEPLLIIHNQPVVKANCPKDIIPQLAVWHISGRGTECKNFRMMFPPSCSSHGE